MSQLGSELYYLPPFSRLCCVARHACGESYVACGGAYAEAKLGRVVMLSGSSRTAKNVGRGVTATLRKENDGGIV
jgi:hypothetical protein